MYWCLSYIGVQPASSFFIILTSKACTKSCVYLMLLVYVIRRRLPYTCSYYLNSVFTRHQTFDLAPYSIHYHKISLKYRIHFLNNRVMISCFWMKLPCGSLWKICPEDRNRDYIVVWNCLYARILFPALKQKHEIEL